MIKKYTHRVYRFGMGIMMWLGATTVSNGALLPLTVLTMPDITIQSMVLMGDVGHTQLIFTLPQPVFYQIESDPTKNTLTLILDNINADSPLLPVNTDNTAIQAIQMDANTQHQFLITLKLLPNVTLQGLKLINDHPAKLIVDIGLAPVVPYIFSGREAPKNSGPVQPLIKIFEPPAPEWMHLQNYQQALDLISQKNFPAAITLLQMIIAQQPDFSAAKITLAKLYLSQDQAKLALNTLVPLPAASVFADETLKQNYMDVLAEAYRQNNQPLNAIKLYRRLLDENPDNSVWWAGLGLCFAALHQQAAAQEAYQKAQKLGNLPAALSNYITQQISFSHTRTP